MQYIKASKRPSIRFSTPTESLVYSLAPEEPVTKKQLIEIVTHWIKNHPEDGCGSTDSHKEVSSAVDALASSGWLRPTLFK
jgi:hypothetical protein